MIKLVTIMSTNSVTKIQAEALTPYSNLLKLLNNFVAAFLIGEVVALHELGQPII